MQAMRRRSVSKQAQRLLPRFRMRPRGVRLSLGKSLPTSRASSTEEKKGKFGSTHSAHLWPLEASVATSSSLGLDLGNLSSAASEQAMRLKVRSSVKARDMGREKTRGAVAVCQSA